VGEKRLGEAISTVRLQSLEGWRLFRCSNLSGTATKNRARCWRLGAGIDGEFSSDSTLSFRGGLGIANLKPSNSWVGGTCEFRRDCYLTAVNFLSGTNNKGHSDCGGYSNAVIEHG